MRVKIYANRACCRIINILLPGLLLCFSLWLPDIGYAATQDADKPAELTIDGKIKKKSDSSPTIGDGPLIDLPAPLEILPPKENNQNAGERNEDSFDLKPDANSVELPPIQRDFSKLPKPVAQMRNLIMKAARSGKIEDLRELIGSGEDITMLSLGGIDGDPIEFFKSLSGDDQGHEILAILLEVLEAGYVHLDAGTDHELYVWPYFFAWPLDRLTPVQKVELFRIVTAGDYEDMLMFGAYIFYRVGITPQGRWRFFVAGD